MVLHRVHFLYFPIMIVKKDVVALFNLPNSGRAKSPGLALFGSGVRVVVPLRVRIQPISGNGLP